MALKGIKVIELAGLAPVPFCGMVLSDFGARVIRIDRPSGVSIDRLARGKQSVSVNLKKEKGINVVKRLCQSADVLIEPFRPGVMEKLGLGPEELMKANTKLIYARLTGYGQTGAMALKAGHDINYIAMSGALSRFGRFGERPYPPVNIVGDFAGGGLSCALGILMALYERSVSGKGQMVDSSMVEGSAYIASFIDATNDMLFPKPRGKNWLDGGSAYYDTYQTKDGKYMAVGALEPQFYKDLLKGLGLEGSGTSQSDDQDQQRQLFSKIFATKTSEEWVEVFKDLDACVTPVLTPEEAADHPHNKERGLFIRGTVPELQGAPAPRLSRTGADGTERALPDCGANTVDVLLEHGFSETEINDLVSSGAISSNAKL
ncbi:alpha-methylacyl-CoA racemase [Aplysia californica]|uniref:Alpha-methylacyl-CoA racemase n=1 Tax=Aplysia californica TaxID=6500 RepID=A0ABM0ZU99_APLCA|nr:alpha-methylacyl-CoA racemase [Aplysia californica]XP_012934592.1 alpha-methylacyl-CoA racemase [Aplysia californica]XP_012934594.1 alpha-methylacyl-CoA racemase [Aplysia californica]